MLRNYLRSIPRLGRSGIPSQLIKRQIFVRNLASLDKEEDHLPDLSTLPRKGKFKFTKKHTKIKQKQNKNETKTRIIGY